MPGSGLPAARRGMPELSGSDSEVLELQLESAAREESCRNYFSENAESSAVSKSVLKKGPMRDGANWSSAVSKNIWAWLGSAGLGLARLGSARLG
jgi:hypothetical protein